MASFLVLCRQLPARFGLVAETADKLVNVGFGSFNRREPTFVRPAEKTMGKALPWNYSLRRLLYP